MTDEKVILAVVAELMVGVRIEEAAKSLGARVETGAAIGDVGGQILGVKADLVVADLALEGLDVDTLAAATRAAGAPMIGFYPHVDAELRRKARAAGVERLYPRSRFLRELPAILRGALES
ncbi:MAG TPA: hypothetical protein VGR43_09615 [Dehalococcoidia bacterium]|jgi:hypothetical protein|nr:hypothetical protein [Dehalococcoidia bacterium]